ncbi:MAG: PAS domain-containing sensor histidine kinase [bacterium]
MAQELNNELKEKSGELLQLQLAAIVEDSHDAIIGKTLDGIITSWNGGAKKMFGYSPEEVIGKSMANLFPPELKDELPRLLEKVRRGEIIADYDSIWLRKDGTRADVEFSISPVHGEDRNIVGASLVGRDITERKKANRQIEELNEVRNKFISIISHQLGTPLAAVNWNIESILNGDFGKLEETTRKFLLITHRASIDITNRIHDLLSAMDIEEGRVVFHTEEASLDSITAAIINEMRKISELKNISFKYIVPEKDISPVVVDIEKIRTSITKLVENAIIYTKENGEIVAKLEERGDMVHFEISDTGVGIPSLEQHHIFTRFFRASNASIMEPDAFGLGLFITESFIKQHGGTVGFESKEGKGSIFWFEVPTRSINQNK